MRGRLCILLPAIFENVFDNVLVRLTTLRSRPRTLRFFRGQVHTSRDIDQGQMAFFQFQYEISKWCGSFGHEIMVRKQFMA